MDEKARFIYEDYVFILSFKEVRYTGTVGVGAFFGFDYGILFCR